MASTARFEVVAIGNAIVDVIARAEDALIEAEGLTKGSMRLIDAEEAGRLYAACGSSPMRVISPSNPCARRVSAAVTPAMPLPTMTMRCMLISGSTLRRGRPGRRRSRPLPLDCPQ